MKKYIFCIFAILAVLFAGACAPATTEPAPPFSEQPGASFAPVVAPSANGDEISILVPKTYRSASYDDVMERLNGMLDEQGQDIRFVLADNTYSSNDDPGSYYQNLRAEFTSGNFTADAYAVYPYLGERLEEEGFGMDLATILPDAVPAYYGKIKDRYEQGEKILSLPIGMNHYSTSMQTALMLRKDYEEQLKPEFRTISDVFGFIESNFVVQNKTSSILAYPMTLASLWVLEQGYYVIGAESGTGFLCAKIDDPDCKPVLLETIPGFIEFDDRKVKLYAGGYLRTPENTAEGWDNIGMIRNLMDYYQPDPYNLYAWMGGEYMAHELFANLPAYEISGSYPNGMLFLPPESPNAADVLRFIEWIYESENNYDIVVYGREGVDYSKAGGRMTVLSNGSPATFRNRQAMGGLFAAWPGVQYFSCTDYNLLPANAPDNIEQIIDRGNSGRERFPYDALLERANDESRAFLVPTDEMQGVLRERQRLLINIIISEHAGERDLLMKPLENLKNDWLLGECADRMAKFKSSVDAQK